ncbi:MAG: FAD-binding oxidoreductase [Candidatus Eremiobacteraeota bacterium]|nr:FAD-binding oxidoreductase [Candidatus Eremiobacteraeota bacterium]
MISAVRREAPATIDGLRTIAADCDAAREAIVIEGGKTLRGMGRSASRCDLILCTTALDQIVEHEQRDLTCSAQAGMTLAKLGTRLAKAGQFVPFDAPQRRTATIGGTLAAGWAGPRRHIYGPVRDYVIGSQVVLADGTLAHAGGMVVKNVTGYDMSKLYVGSFGTLGIFVQANFKTLPLPAHTRAFVAALPERTRSRAIAEISALPVAPAAAFCIEGYRKNIDGEDGVDGRLFVLLEGSSGLIDRATRDLRSSLGKAGVPETTIIDSGARESFERVLDSTIASVAERSITYRSGGLPETVEHRSLSMRDAAHRLELFTDVLVDIMNGDVFLRVSERDTRAFASRIEMFDDAVHAAEPGAIVIAGDSPMRGSLDVWGADPQALSYMRAMKARFDPNATLNPGRYVGRI